MTLHLLLHQFQQTMLDQYQSLHQFQRTMLHRYQSLQTCREDQ